MRSGKPQLFVAHDVQRRIVDAFPIMQKDETPSQERTEAPSDQIEPGRGGAAHGDVEIDPVLKPVRNDVLARVANMQLFPLARNVK